MASFFLHCHVTPGNDELHQVVGGQVLEVLDVLEVILGLCLALWFRIHNAPSQLRLARGQLPDKIGQ